MLILITVALALRHTYFLLVLIPALAAVIYVSIISHKYAVLIAVVVLTGIACLKGAGIYHTPESLESYDGAYVTLTAQMVTYPEYDSGVSAVFRCLSINGKTVENVRILIRVYSSDETFLPGGVYSFEGTLKIAGHATNPGGFDYKIYLASENIGAYMNVYGKASYLYTAHLPFYYDKILMLRASCDGILRSNLNTDEAGLMSGMLFGSSYMDSDLLSDYRIVGAAHILAVSGLHVGVLYMFVMFILKRVKATPKISFATVTSVLVLYAMLTGFSVSVLRASLMLWLLAFSRILNRKTDSFNCLCVAACILLTINPFMFYSVSFQMSFCAAASLLIFLPFIRAKIKNPKNKFCAGFIDLLLACLTVQIGLLPVTVYYFNNINLLSVAANLLIIPMVSVALIGGIVVVILSACIPAAAFVFFYPLNIILLCLNGIASAIAKVNYSLFYVASPRVCEIVLCYALMFLVCGYFRLKSKKCKIILSSGICMLGLYCLCLYLPPLHTVISFVDVGFGDCCIIMTNKGENILIDGGGYLNNDTAKYDIVPFLEYYKIKTLDAVIVTHSHSDHINGIINLLDYAHIDVKEIYADDDGQPLYDALVVKAAARNIAVTPLYAGDLLKYDGVVLNVLLPYSSMLGGSEVNESSIVLLCVAGNTSVLMLGDAEEEELEILMQQYHLTAADIIKANHHGAYGYNTPELYRSATPEVSIISCGSNNYGLPNEELFDLFESTNTLWYSTEDNGCIRVIIFNDGYQIKTFLE